ncbi:MAG: hypothetical protein Q9216_004818 [Gyalolechia sp. 2 TL-2023]
MVSTQALTWSLFSIAAGFFGARICIRFKLNKRLQLDDGLVALSMLMFTALSILQTAYVDTTFKVQAVRTEHRPMPADFEEASNRYARYQWAIAYFFFTGIWAVKGSFLAFYDKLTQRLPRIRKAWWIGIVITFLTYIGSLFAYAFLNGLKFKRSLRNKAINYQFAADFATDIIITAIPLTLALQSSVPTRQKLLLSLIFSMTLIITIFSIVRYTVNRPGRPPAGPSWLQVWSSIEHCASISIASAASFRAFVVQQRGSTAEEELVSAFEEASEARVGLLAAYGAG